MTVTDFLCTRCNKLCDAVEDIEIDMEPYGDRMVERRTYVYYSFCCGVDVEFLEAEETIH